ncbi:quinoprotein glucose dehydrogenase [Chitinophaga terrae (ex Kim and Jung 2007)]|uniref:outer membrane protein assembly factor BamB family protein n=1 Tax=Chitinophaga terrae (ex Kim and Jung 2007) TaxID=408074 RepID=UPI00278B7536|nr:PQQ-binding-like beta-propeller repeat protein [Chitinophaga terrae (ex Kim and Jung 2007)]MDQ0108795.1 quinoprotein glucose dehydrogenase [Chitinophaga terrae (ex Kim and Jung 2007)]
MLRKIPQLCILLLNCILFSCRPSGNTDVDWAVYGGNKAGTRYSSLKEVDTSNVAGLTVAWAYHTNDADTVGKSQIQCNPLVINGVLYGISPRQKVFALNAATGELLWSFDPLHQTGMDAGMMGMNNMRGLAYWTDNKSARLLFTSGSYLHCLDASTGKIIPSFGDQGKVDLHNGFAREVSDLYITSTSPGVVFKDLLILGSRVDEGPNAAPGDIRAFNILTGKLQWSFHTIPHPGEPGYENWADPEAYKHIGGANCWSGFTLDEERETVFAATGSASYDFYGGMRKGANLFADCILALDANTGKRKWHFQQIHHDIWDKDLPSPPALITVTHNGKKIPAVAQATKTGYVYVLNRETGEPLFEVKEDTVPHISTLAGEQVSPTQPRPVLPKPFVRQVFNDSDINRFLPQREQDSIRQVLQEVGHGHMFLPPSERGTIIMPGFDGGAEWGGQAFDEATGLFYVNANELPWILKMLPAKPAETSSETNLQAGKRLYATHCMVCHGSDLKGGGNYPSLTDVASRYSVKAFNELLLGGRRMMPAFTLLKQEERDALASFILKQEQQQKMQYKGPRPAPNPYLQMPYMGNGYIKFLSPGGAPAINPPWGTLSAINLNTGQTAWQIPLGEDSTLKKAGIISGTENYGGPVVTAGGLLFIAATADSKFRAFNKLTGKLLWETDLPACGFATPAIYRVRNRQYIVIACGGGKLGKKSGDTYLAFALP